MKIWFFAENSEYYFVVNKCFNQVELICTVSIVGYDAALSTE